MLARFLLVLDFLSTFDVFTKVVPLLSNLVFCISWETLGNGDLASEIILCIFYAYET
jgi:hypothetical protein